MNIHHVLSLLTLENIQRFLTILTYIVTIASAIAPILPHPEKTEGFLSKLSSVINTLALNLDKIKRK